MDNGIVQSIANAFVSVTPAVLFIAIVERAVGMLVRAVSGSGRLM